MKKTFFISLSLISWWFIGIWIFSKIPTSNNMSYGASLYTAAFGYSPVLSCVITYLTMKHFSKIKINHTFWLLTMFYLLIAIYGINFIVKI